MAIAPPNIPGTIRESVPPEKPTAGEEAAAIAAILTVLREGERFLVCSHSRPDGDAVGSMLAMGMILQQLGKRVDLISADRIPENYRSLPLADSIQTVQRPWGPYDAAILLECDGTERTRLRGLEDFFLINIDHHISGVPFGQLNWIDHQAASVGELVYRLALAAGVSVTAEMANCLYTTVLTDTGGFRYGSLNASTFAFARDLVMAGADAAEIARQVYFSAPASKLLLLGAALDNLKREGRISWLWVTHPEMLRACATEEDCEGIVNYALSIYGVEAAVFLRELPDHSFRLSLRSKGTVNVAALAETLGGGGHEAAAGCSLNGPLQAALDQILPALRDSVALAFPNGHAGSCDSCGIC